MTGSSTISHNFKCASFQILSHALYGINSLNNVSSKTTKITKTTKPRRLDHPMPTPTPLKISKPCEASVWWSGPCRNAAAWRKWDATLSKKCPLSFPRPWPLYIHCSFRANLALDTSLSFRLATWFHVIAAKQARLWVAAEKRCSIVCGFMWQNMAKPGISMCKQ